MSTKLVINVPACCMGENKVNQEIHILCKKLCDKIEISKYTCRLDTINITPDISHVRGTRKRRKSQRVMISTEYKIANISLQICFEDYTQTPDEKKKEVILNNIFSALKLVKAKLKNEFDYESMEKDISDIWNS